MKALNRISDYVNKPYFKIIITPQTINIINYLEIKKFDEEEIIVVGGEKNYSIQGNNLALSRLLENELLVKGEFEKIELK